MAAAGSFFMSTRSETLKAQVLQIGAWSICLPALAFWPFLSAFPLFALIGETQPGLLTANILFLLTGFWPALALFLVLRFASGGMRQTVERPGISRLGLMAGAYATVWTLAYGLFSLT
jgi:hypothetical protein